MNIQTITKMLTDAGIEPNEAKIEVKMLLEHFCKYTEKGRHGNRCFVDAA